MRTCLAQAVELKAKMAEANVAFYFRVVLLVCCFTVSSADCYTAGWVSFGNSCYKVVANSSKSWTDARADCLNYGGDLVSIHCAEEQAFISSQEQQYPGRTNFWIGLHDRAHENVFEWSDRTSLTYTNWYVGEPNNAGGQEDCVEHLRFKWNDNACKVQLNYICKRQKDCKIQRIEVSSSASFPDNRWIASSSKSGNEPYKARLDGAGAWVPASNTGADYLQIDLGAVYVICAVATQGNPNKDEWTKTYKIKTSVNKVYWTDHDNGNSRKVFIGNANRYSTIKQTSLN